MTKTPADFAARVNAMFADFDRPDSPGLVVLVQKDGEDVFCGSYGMANLNFAVPNSRETIIRNGSQSKQFTCLLALLLEAEGKLSMADPVRLHFPELPDFHDGITLEHLARNDGGMRDHFQSIVLSGLTLNDRISRAETLEFIRRQEALNFAPGSQTSYCNSGFILLSELIERLEGKSFDAVLQERICKPLGLTNTRNVWLDGLAVPGMAQHYSKEADGWYALNWGLPIGGEGGIATTVDDMMIWMANFDRPRVGTPEMMARMQTPRVFPNGTVSGYGMGLLVQHYRGRTYVGHGGSIEGGRSHGGRFLEDGLAIEILANCDVVDAMRFVRRIADAYFDTPAPVPLPFRDGRYRERGGAQILQIRHRDGQPEIMNLGSGFEGLDCAPAKGATREGGIINCHYRATKDGAIEGEDCGTPFRFEPLEPSVPTPLPIAGQYELPGQRMMASITVDEGAGRIVLRTDFGEMRAGLEAVAPDLWLMGPSDKRTGYDAPFAGTILRTEAGFTLTTARNKNMAFQKIGA